MLVNGHVVRDSDQLRAVTVGSIPEEIHFALRSLMAQHTSLPGQSFLTDLVLSMGQHLIRGSIPVVTFTIREVAHIVGSGRVQSVLANREI